MLTLFFMMLGCEKLIFKLWRLSLCSGDVKQDAVEHIRPGTRLRPPGSGRIRCSGISPPPDDGDVGDRDGLEVELTEAPGEVAEFRSPATPRPDPGLAARSHALYCCPGPFRCSDPRSLRPEPGRPRRDKPLFEPERLLSLFCDHIVQGKRKRRKLTKNATTYFWRLKNSSQKKFMDIGPKGYCCTFGSAEWTKNWKEQKITFCPQFKKTLQLVNDTACSKFFFLNFFLFFTIFLLCCCAWFFSLHTHVSVRPKWTLHGVSSVAVYCSQVLCSSTFNFQCLSR